MAATGYAAQGTIPTVTSGAGRRVAITSSTNATPIKITSAGHGFLTGDSVEIEGHATNTNANGQWQITLVDANSYTLNGSVGNGVGGATGYAIDYQLQPAVMIPAPGDPASMVTLGPVLEGNANPAPFLYRRLGKWRLYNEYYIYQGNPLTTPFYSHNWSDTGTGITTGTWTTFPSASFTLEALSDTPSLPPVSISGEFFVFNVSFNVYLTISGAGAEGAHLNVGASLQSGSSPNMLLQPMAEFTAPQTTVSCAFPITLAGTLGPVEWIAPGFVSNMCLNINYRVDYLPAGSVQMQLIGPLTGSIMQYRPN